MPSKKRAAQDDLNANATKAKVVEKEVSGSSDSEEGSVDSGVIAVDGAAITANSDSDEDASDDEDASGEEDKSDNEDSEDEGTDGDSNEEEAGDEAVKDEGAAAEGGGADELEMEEGDIKLECRDCSGAFLFTKGEQEYFETKGFDGQPSRCKPCRVAKKNADGGGKVRKALVLVAPGRLSHRLSFVIPGWQGWQGRQGRQGRRWWCRCVLRLPERVVLAGRRVPLLP